MIDFGIAKMTQLDALTATGQTMGTVRYMSPEQVRGQDGRPAHRLYSLGATLYESLVGDTPFDGENHFDIMKQHLRNRPPALAKMGVAVPSPLEKALLWRSRRTPTIAMPTRRRCGEAMEAVLPELPRGDDATVAAAAGRQEPRGAGAGLAVLIAGGAGATFLLARQMAHTTQPAVTTRRRRVEDRAAERAAGQAGAAKPRWLVPHAVAGETLATDETFKADGVRVQSTAKRDPALVRDAYRSVSASCGRSWPRAMCRPRARWRPSSSRRRSTSSSCRRP